MADPRTAAVLSAKACLEAQLGPLEELQPAAVAANEVKRAEDAPAATLQPKGHTGETMRSPPQATLADEEATYVLLDLAALGRSPTVTEALAPGQQVYFHGLDTLTPTISLNDGTVAKLAYEDSIGTCLVLSETDPPPDKKIQLSYLGQTEKLLFAQPEGNRAMPPRFTLQRY